MKAADLRDRKLRILKKKWREWPLTGVKGMKKGENCGTLWINTGEHKESRQG